jgi:fatty-acyl-CoA synthase
MSDIGLQAAPLMPRSHELGCRRASQFDAAVRDGNDALSARKDWLRALEATASIGPNPRRLLSDIIEELAKTRGESPALLSSGECLTYGGLAERANRFARWALDRGLVKGDCVCLMMPNRPEYMAIWLGLTSVGIVVSLINTHLRGPSLTHSVQIVAPRHAIVDHDLFEEFCSSVAHLANPPRVWSHGRNSDHMNPAVERFSGARLSASERPVVTVADRALFIYTSGTTGLPKAVNVSHRRLLEWSLWFAGLLNTGPDDRIYNCLPMYHSVGGVVATGALLTRGGAVLIREKFSAHQFWDDVVNWDCTLVQYIGELCRYLLNAPSSAKERAHHIRMFCGNGLRADVWKQFQERFAIPRILEFYAATEGNVTLYNVEGKVGAIGRNPTYLRHRFPLVLVKFDVVTGEPVRNQKGFCIRCATNEVGEAIGRMRIGAAQIGGDFEGYTNTADSERKILREVFAPGDAWYRTGDLMRMDAAGFFYFVDRIGDTFRWKGENVATSEVVAAIMAFPGIKEASVYGVRVPGTEGAAGMAAVVSEGPVDFVAFRNHLERLLPPYARPVFVRITDGIEATTTFKPIKVELVKQGYDPATTSDPIYFDDRARGSFVHIDEANFARIQAGEIRL